MDTNTNNIYRDVTMDNISEANVGQTMKICGWVENIRDHGGVSFIDLRDMYGQMQVVMRDTSLLDGISQVGTSDVFNTGSSTFKLVL